MAVAVRVGVGVGVGVWLGVAVGVFVAVAVSVGVSVAVLVGVAVGVVVGVGVLVKTTTMPLPGVHGTDVSLVPERISRSQVVTFSGLSPSACPWNVTLTMLIGSAEATGVRQANEQTTRPIGGVGPGVAHKVTQSVKGGGTSAAVARTTVESYSTVKS